MVRVEARGRDDGRATTNSFWQAMFSERARFSGRAHVVWEHAPYSLRFAFSFPPSYHRFHPPPFTHGRPTTIRTSCFCVAKMERQAGSGSQVGSTGEDNPLKMMEGQGNRVRLLVGGESQWKLADRVRIATDLSKCTLNVCVGWFDDRKQGVHQ